MFNNNIWNIAKICRRANREFVYSEKILAIFQEAR